MDESSIAEVSVRASSPISCTCVVITSLTSGDDCGTDIHSSIVGDTFPRGTRCLNDTVISHLSGGIHERTVGQLQGALLHPPGVRHMS